MGLNGMNKVGTTWDAFWYWQDGEIINLFKDILAHNGKKLDVSLEIQNVKKYNNKLALMI